MIFCILRIFRLRKRFEGEVFWLYVLMYGIIRSIIEAFREDFRGGFIFSLSPSQFIGLCLSLIAAIMLIISKKTDLRIEKRSRVYGRN